MILTQSEHFKFLFKRFIGETHIELVVNEIKVQVTYSMFQKPGKLGLKFLKL